MAAVRAALALALQMPPQGLPDNTALVRALQGQALLVVVVVVDNAEHLLDVLAPWSPSCRRSCRWCTGW